MIREANEEKMDEGIYRVLYINNYEPYSKSQIFHIYKII